MKLIDQALKDGRTALSDYESKQVLASYGIPVTQEVRDQSGGPSSKLSGKSGIPWL